VKTERPWGFYEVLGSGTAFQVKLIHVNAGKRLSLQSHKFRAEHWFILTGRATVQKGDQVFNLSSGHSINISQGEIHRISAPIDCDVEFIEVQTGTSFDEDDIERFDDDFGRA
jgi:mannose-6-phosphate isomerase-like protein (cupin superfamily)